MSKRVSKRAAAVQTPVDSGRYEQPLALVSVSGTARSCGEQLGYIWAQDLRLYASRPGRSEQAWWKHKPYQRWIARLCPHLPDLYQGLARGAGLKEDAVGSRVTLPAQSSGCTSFAIAPSQTAAGQPISGQTKDTPVHRLFQFLVLRVKMSDAPSMLTLTYPGWLFGHGFVEGGCSVFRNSLWAGDPRGGLPHTAWGLLTLHCRTVDEAMKLTRDGGCDMGSHAAIADMHGGIVGMEITAKRLAFLKPRGGLYTHANAICGWAGGAKDERSDPHFQRDNSLLRQERMRSRLEAHGRRLTAALAFAAMADHEGHPHGICRHAGPQSSTTAAVVVEPARGLLHACRGRPCENFPQTFSL
jgi:hypothetical protein